MKRVKVEHNDWAASIYSFKNEQEAKLFIGDLFANHQSTLDTPNVWLLNDDLNYATNSANDNKRGQYNEH